MSINPINNFIMFIKYHTYRNYAKDSTLKRIIAYNMLVYAINPTTYVFILFRLFNSWDRHVHSCKNILKIRMNPRKFKKILKIFQLIKFIRIRILFN